MKIGIPRAGYYFKFGEKWKSFFENLGDNLIYDEINLEIILNKI